MKTIILIVLFIVSSAFRDVPFPETISPSDGKIVSDVNVKNRLYEKIKDNLLFGINYIKTGDAKYVLYPKKIIYKQVLDIEPPQDFSNFDIEFSNCNHQMRYYQAVLQQTMVGVPVAFVVGNSFFDPDGTFNIKTHAFLLIVAEDDIVQFGGNISEYLFIRECQLY